MILEIPYKNYIIIGMDLFITIILIIIMAETTALLLKEFAGKNMRINSSERRKVFIDTSTLMDGRILSVAKAGFLGDHILIPRSVIRELQLLADGSDAEKRARARFGLDVVNELERVELSYVEIYADDDSRVKVDERLIELAKEHHGIILTNDFNLAKVAATERIDAININDLAQGLRSEYLPGDKLRVKIISVGSNAHQGVAYLPDGTMVVVDNGERYAGKNQIIEIEFIRYLQTNAGKMMFARITEEQTAKKSKQSKKRTVGRRHRTTKK